MFEFGNWFASRVLKWKFSNVISKVGYTAFNDRILIFFKWKINQKIKI